MKTVMSPLATTGGNPDPPLDQRIPKALAARELNLAARTFDRRIAAGEFRQRYRPRAGARPEAVIHPADVRQLLHTAAALRHAVLHHHRRDTSWIPLWELTQRLAQHAGALAWRMHLIDDAAFFADEDEEELMRENRRELAAESKALRDAAAYWRDHNNDPRR